MLHAGKVKLPTMDGRKAAAERHKNMPETKGLAAGPKTGADAVVESVARSLREPAGSLPRLLGKLAETSLGQGQRALIEQLALHAGEILAVQADTEIWTSLRAEAQGDCLAFNLHDMLDEIVDGLEERAGKLGNLLRGKVTVPFRFRVVADQTLLRTAILKLASHSLESTRDGQLLVTVGCANPSSPEVRLDVEVRDTGAPVSEADASAYFQTCQTGGTARRGDTGFGLALVSAVVDSVGGNLTASPAQPTGATFRFSFPAILKPADEADLENQPLRCSNSWIVQDRTRPVSLLHSRLDAWCGCCERMEESAFWPSLQEAVAATDPHAGSPMLVVADLRTVPDNLDFARRVLSRFNGANLRIVMVTDSALPPSDSTLTTSGVDGVLSRPMCVAETRRVVETVLQHRESATSEFQCTRTDAEPSATTRIRVLLVDDNPINRKVGIRQLERLGYESESATNGQEAVDAVLRGDWDIVLMDCMMPVMDGFEACRRIRAHEKDHPSAGGRRTPIVALTANVSPQHRAECVACGMDDFLGKPVRPEEMRATIDRVLSTPFAGEVRSAQALAVPANAPARCEAPPGIDMARLHEMADGDASIIEELVLMYLDQTEEQVEQLRAAYDKGDCQIVRRLAHSAYGASSSIGVSTFTTELRQLEHEAERGSLAGLDDAMASVEKGLLGVSAYLREEVLAKKPAALPALGQGAEMQEPSFNPTLLDTIRTAEGTGYAAFVAELGRMFQEQARRHATEIGAALEQRRPDLISDAARALKATGHNLGAERLAVICQRITELAPGAEWDQIRGELGRMDQEIGIVSDMLRQEFEKPRPVQAGAGQ